MYIYKVLVSFPTGCAAVENVPRPDPEKERKAKVNFARLKRTLESKEGAKNIPTH